MNAINPVHFLLVDDLQENLLALEALLRRDGLVLLKASNGPDALELLLRHDIALALVDVQMPGMDGFELAELMRGTERTRRVPIIFLTAGNPDNQRQFRGYEAGAVDFIRKPIETDILRSKADVFFELYRQRQEVARQRDELRIATDENARLLAESRKHAAALSEADRRKDEFLATLAHELRNPLAPIRNAVEMMRVKGLTDPDLEWARDVIDRQAANMVRLIDELLDVSRIATGKLVLRRTHTHLARVIDQAIELTRTLIETNGHQLTVDLPSAPIPIEVDEVRMTQVFSNLLTNAAKYTERGGRIHISGRMVDREIEVRVEDTGIGIPHEMLGEVFGLFTQVDRSLERAQGGLGVGLALVQRLMALHGGTVSAESAGVGQGSAFIVRFPAEPITSTVTISADAKPDAPTAMLTSTRRVLVIDDHVDGAQSLSTLLRLMGHQTRIAHTGPDGLTAALEFQPSVIFLDIGLPGMDGYQVSRKIREEATLAKCTLVALTGWGTDEDRRRSAAAGFDFHLTKPVQSASLTEIFTKTPRANT